MKEYKSINITTQPKSVEIISQVLSCPTIEQILFPGFIPFSKTDRLDLTSPAQFHTSSIPDKYIEQISSSAVGATFPFFHISNGLKVKVLIFGEEGRIPGMSVVVNFNEQHIKDGLINKVVLVNIIRELVPVLNTSNSVVDRKLARDLRKNLETFQGPLTEYIVRLGWMSYFGPDLVGHLGHERFGKLQTCVEKIEIGGGYLIILQDEAFDVTNPDHRAREARAIEELGLRDFLVPQRPKIKGKLQLPGLKPKND